MFVTPRLPPLAMPPIVESSYWEERLRSALRYKKLLSGDVASPARMKDMDGELAAVGYYSGWLHREGGFSNRLRAQFYRGLFRDLSENYEEVQKE